jgi:hypothetical protein
VPSQQGEDSGAREVGFAPRGAGGRTVHSVRTSARALTTQQVLLQSHSVRDMEGWGDPAAITGKLV